MADNSATPTNVVSITEETIQHFVNMVAQTELLAKSMDLSLPRAAEALMRSMQICQSMTAVSVTDVVSKTKH